MELGAFYSQIGSVKVFNTEQYSGGQCTIYKDPSDPDLAAKVAAVKLAVDKIGQKGVALPSGLRVYCTGAFAAQNRAFHRDAGWNAVAYVILRSQGSHRRTAGCNVRNWPGWM